tara:strand:- start:86 stop:283 length:198 start_codon:yes stop_codon:yes gene_type:complete
MKNRPILQNERFWNLPDESLRYIAKDAKEAAANLPDCPKTGIWLDEVNDACTVMFYRKNQAAEEK